MASVANAQSSPPQQGCPFENQYYPVGYLLVINHDELKETFTDKGKYIPDGEYKFARCAFVVNPAKSEYPQIKQYVWTNNTRY